MTQASFYKVFAKIALVALALLATIGSANLQDGVINRIQPVAKLCMAGDPCSVAVTIASLPPAKRDVDTLYQRGCQACHLSGVSGAPVTGVAEQWKSRMSQGIDTLYQHAFKGYNSMPAKGLCTDCTEAEIRKLVDYMVKSSGL